jgi:microcin C transport system substrate-binding protein
MQRVASAALSALLFTSLNAHAAAVPNQGMAMHGEPKYKPDAKVLDYANPDAPKGGTLTLGEEGSFDSLNPYGLKDDSPIWVQSLLFQELGEQALDEPFTMYPALAESLDVAPDKLSMTIKLRSNAKFSDGKPITAEDVQFSFNLFKSDKVRPFYKFYWADIKEVQVVDRLTAKMIFSQVNPELPLIALQLPVLPKHFYGKGDFSKDFAQKALGSGPYVVKEFKAPQYVVLKRNPDFWGKDLAIYKGRYNFDEIYVKYYKDNTAMVEGFKKGDFDLDDINSSKVWALDMAGDKFEKKWIKKELWANQNNAGTQGFIFNMRKPIFQDVRVRQAMALAFDFSWSNKNLFYDQYRENKSFFENSPLKATGLPTEAELAVLNPLKADLPPEVFSKEMGWLGKGKDIKDRLREAMGLLKEAGYSVKDGVAQGPAGKLEFKVLIDGPTWGRIMEPYIQNLKKIGIVASIEEKEQSLYIKRVENREFDMIVQVYGQSQSPGNEQRDFWSTAAADQNYSRNYSGVKSKAIDALIDKVIYAKDRQELELMTRCLDRALYHTHLLVHNWHSPAHRVAYWDKLGRPEKLADYYVARQMFEYMWYDAAKAKKLEEARSKNAPLL